MDTEYSPASSKPSPSLPKDKFFFRVDKSDVGRTGFVKLRGKGSKIMKYREVLKMFLSLQLDLNANL